MPRAPERCPYCLRGERLCNCTQDCGARLTFVTPDCRHAPAEGLALDDVWGSADGSQRDAIVAWLAVCGVTGQAERLVHVEAIIGHSIEWIGDLSYTEAGRVLEALSGRARATR